MTVVVLIISLNNIRDKHAIIDGWKKVGSVSVGGCPKMYFMGNIIKNNEIGIRVKSLNGH